MIGKSDYILVYDERKRIVADGNSYLLGEFLVLKSDYGLWHTPVEASPA